MGVSVGGMQRDAPEVALGEILALGVEGDACWIRSARAEADQTPAHADQLAGSGVAALPDVIQKIVQLKLMLLSTHTGRASAIT